MGMGKKDPHNTLLLVSMAAEDRGGEISGLFFMDGRDQFSVAVVVSVWM